MNVISRTDPDRLVEAYRSYAHAISAEALKKLPPSVDRDDVIGAAELGLVEASRSFDPSRGVLFKTFAYYRIRGAIYDALRKMGWFRQDSRVRFEAGANDYMRDYTETAPSDNPSAAESYQELQQLTTAVVTSFVLSLDSSGRDVADEAQRSPERALLETERERHLHDALARLPEKNRKVLEEYYFKDATLEEIGQRLGLSKSWVCRLHARSLDMVRELMERPATKAVAP